MTAWMVTLFACGEPAPLRSNPSTPTVTFEKEEEIVWTDLAPLFPETPAALPTTIAALRPGMDGEAARAILEAAHQPGVKVFARPVEGHVALGTMLAGADNLGVTLLINESGALESISLSLPDAAALPMLIDRWGDPTEAVMGDKARGSYRWHREGQPWTATLLPDPDQKKAILEFKGA